MKRLAGKKPSILRRPEFPTYVTIRSYWNKCTSGGNLLPGQKKGIAKTFDDDFNPEWCFRDKEEETIQCIDACWRSLPLETRIDIYHYCV